VQDAFLGLTRARQAGTTITDPEAYLTTVVSRLGINYLRSARVRRETYVGDWLPEPVVVPAGGPGPAGRRAGQLAVHGVPGAAGGPLAGGAGGAGTAASRRRRSGSRWPGGSASCGCSPACSAGPGPRRLDPAIRAVVNPGKLGHIGPVSDVARLPPAQNAQFRAPKYGHPANGDPVQNGGYLRGHAKGSGCSP
jgi:hypothetical protein